MKNKTEIAVKITDKNREKVKAILNMFKDWQEHDCLGFKYIHYYKSCWCGIDNTKKDIIKPKELKQILAIEKLKAGDYIKTTYGDIKKFEFPVFDIINFKRYATKEEIAKFEGNKELQVGKWYKHNSGSLCLVESIDESGTVYGYEISSFGVWSNYTNQDGAICLLNSIAKKSVKEATPQEVETALIKEAKKRGLTPYYDTFYFDPTLSVLYDRFGLGQKVVFYDGKWAEVIKNDDKPKVGDVCKFWDNEEDNCVIGIYKEHTGRYHTHTAVWGGFDNAKVLTQEEVIELLFKN